MTLKITLKKQSRPMLNIERKKATLMFFSKFQCKGFNTIAHKFQCNEQKIFCTGIRIFSLVSMKFARLDFSVSFSY